METRHKSAEVVETHDVAAATGGYAVPISNGATIMRAARGRHWADTFQLVLMAAPALVVLCVFHLWASGLNVVMSFTDWSLGSTHFIGIGNYQRLFADPAFKNSLEVTGWFILASVPVTILLALPLAYILYFTLNRTGFYRVILFLPYIIPTVATGLMWTLMFSSSSGGMMNAFLGHLGVSPQSWLLEPRGVFQILAGLFSFRVPGWGAGPSLAMVVIIGARIWEMLGFTIIILLAGLTIMNDEVIEAARTDGATEFQVLRRVVVPMLFPTIFFLSVISVIFAVREFNTFYVMTNGGPANTTQTLPLLMFQQFYQNNQLGYGATTASVMFVIMLVITWLQFRLTRRWSDQ
jgi:ABC-type sugar transport system permease subunit